MNKFFFLLITGGLLLLIMNGCLSKKDDGTLLSDQMEYAVEIGNPVEVEYSKDWLDKASRKEFLTKLLAKVQNGDLPVYYYIPDTLIPMEKEYIADLFHHVDTEFVMVEEEYVPVAYEENLDLDAIVKLKFLEQWYYNDRKNTFTKKVLAICPMLERYKNDKEILGYKGLFWIYLNPKE